MNRWGWPLLVTAIVVLVVLLARAPERGTQKDARNIVERTDGEFPRVNSEASPDSTGEQTDEPSQRKDVPAGSPESRSSVSGDIGHLRDLKDDPLGNHDKACAEIVRRLSRAGADALDEILASVRDDRASMEFRLALLDAVAGISGDASLAAMKEIFTDRNAASLIRNRALAELVRRKNEETFVVLKSVFESDHDYQGRHLILQAMGEIGDRRSVATLADVVRRERDRTLRSHALGALGTYADDRNVGDLLIDIIRNESDVALRTQAVLAVGKGLDADRRTQLRNIFDSEKNEELRGVIEHVLQNP